MGRNLFASDKLKKTDRPGRNLFANDEPKESTLQKLPRNIAAGLAQGGHELLNTPYEVGKNIEQRGQEFGEMVNKSLPLEKYGFKQPQSDFSFADKIPHQEQYNFAQMLGQKGRPTFLDSAIQSTAQYAPAVLMAANSLKDIVPHLTKRGATKTLNKAKRLAAEREIGALNVNPELIEDARQFLPDLLQNRNALNSSHTGDYQSLFDLQSDVGKISAARKGKLRSLFAPETHLKGVAGLESRNRLLDAIHENLQSLGHNDISDLLREGQNDYRKYMKFRKYRNIIGGAAAAYAAPQNPLTDLLKNLWKA